MSKPSLSSLSSSSLLPDFEKILLDRIKELRGAIHEAHNPVYNENLMIELSHICSWIMRV
jgi:hypothetical protein